MDNKQIGNRIKNRRKDLKLTLQEVADMVGVASSTIQRYEKGSISQYKLPVLESIAKALNVNPTWLVKEDAKMETNIQDDIFLKANKPITKVSDPLSFSIKIDDYISSKHKKLSEGELTLLENYSKLNNKGKEKLIEYSDDLTTNIKFIEKDKNTIKLSKYKKQIWEEEEKEFLMPNAAHEMEGNFTEEDYQHDDDIMKDDDFWNK